MKSMVTRPTELSDLTPQQEQARLDKITELDLVGGGTNLQLEEYIAQAKAIAGSKFAAVTILDAKTQWLKSEIGLGVCSTERDIAFCNHTILRPEGVPFIVEDALSHIAFKENPLVLNPPHIRSYLGFPLITAGKHAVGALCVLDNKPRVFTETQIKQLRELARKVVQNLEGS